MKKCQHVWLTIGSVTLGLRLANGRTPSVVTRQCIFCKAVESGVRPILPEH